MKDLNLLEAQLRSLQPRRPSARLRRRLFPRSAAWREAAVALQWLTPAAACLMLAFAVLHQEDGYRSDMAGSDRVLASAASNQSHSAILTVGSSQVEYNTPAIFESTNRTGYTSSISSFLSHRTN